MAPAYGTYQTDSGLMPPFVHWRLLMMQKEERGGIYLIDTLPLPSEMCRPKRAAYKRKPRPPKPAPPPPPTIQDYLRKAYVFKKRMRDDPGLTREVLAQEEGIDLVQMGKILSLLRLTPATQQAILAMPKEKIVAVEKEFWRLVEARLG
jgi:hypothetical protein